MAPSVTTGFGPEVETIERVNLKVAEPSSTLRALNPVTSPAKTASSPESVRPDPVTSPQFIAVAPVPDSWFSWT